MQWSLYLNDIALNNMIQIRGVTIPGLESDFHHFLGINNSDSNSNSSKNQFSNCTGIDFGTGINAKMDSILIPIPIPEKNGIETPLIQINVGKVTF